MKVAACLALSACCTLPLVAGPAFSMGVNTGACGYFAHLADDDLPFRSSAQLSFSPALGIASDSYGIYAYAPISYISPSKEFNSKKLKPCLKLGIGVQGMWYFSPRWGFMTALAYSHGRYLSPDEGSFDSVSLALSPLLDVRFGSAGRVEFSFPVGLDFRDWVVAPTFGVGVSYRYEMRHDP